MTNYKRYKDGMARILLKDVEYTLFCKHMDMEEVAKGKGFLTLAKDFDDDIVAAIFSCNECVKTTEEEMMGVDDCSEIQTVPSNGFFITDR